MRRRFLEPRVFRNCVRTYVRHGENAGVRFFSLDAASRLAVTVARAWFHLPYFFAQMSCEGRSGWIGYASERKDRSSPAAVLCGKYRREGNTLHAAGKTLEHFLTERYCLYRADTDGTLKRGDIHHPPWNLQVAQAEISENSMTKGLGLDLGTPNCCIFRAGKMWRCGRGGACWAAQALRVRETRPGGAVGSMGGSLERSMGL